jgi:hypothetical protein
VVQQGRGRIGTRGSELELATRLVRPTLVVHVEQAMTTLTSAWLERVTADVRGGRQPVPVHDLSAGRPTLRAADVPKLDRPDMGRNALSGSRAALLGRMDCDDLPIR